MDIDKQTFANSCSGSAAVGQKRKYSTFGCPPGSGHSRAAIH